MFNCKTLAVILVGVSFLGGRAFGRSVEQDWNDFLHYTKIGRFSLAKGYAEALLGGEPDPVQVLSLSKANPQSMILLERVFEKAPDPELAELAGRILEIIDEGTFVLRADTRIIIEQITKLSGTKRAQLKAVKQLQDAGEYAIPHMLDAMFDHSRRQEFPNITGALPEVGRDGIRPLAAALQMTDVPIKVEIVKALGKIGYPQVLPHLKYLVEKDTSAKLREQARQSITRIDPTVLQLSAARLFYALAENYYYHSESLASAEDADFANVWFWDGSQRRLAREKVGKDFFNELMAMRSCEWALRADPGFGQAIGLWLAAYFKAESGGIKEKMPAYFGRGHADAMTYATTAGPEYLHQALGRAVKDKNAYVALGVIEALAAIAGEKSLLYRVGPAQPLAESLSFDDAAVRYSAAIAIAAAGPQEAFAETKLVVRNLAEAIGQKHNQPQIANEWVEQDYAVRSAKVMLKLGETRNPVINLAAAQEALIEATKDDRPPIQVLAAKILTHIGSSAAQSAIALMGLSEKNNLQVRISAFDSLAVSAKINANLLEDDKIDAIYSLVGSQQSDPNLRAAAASAYGSLNLPSRKVKDLILDQAKS